MCFHFSITSVWRNAHSLEYQNTSHKIPPEAGRWNKKQHKFSWPKVSRSQVVSIGIDQENDSEHPVVSICEVREEQVYGNSEAKNQTVSESNTVSSCVKEENGANSSTSMEMIFSVSQSNMLYGYHTFFTTLVLLQFRFASNDCKFSSV